MIAHIMALSVRARWAVLFLFLAIAGIGLWQLTRLPIDARPGHHQQAGADQHDRPGPVAGRDGKARHLSDRDGPRRHTGLETTRSLSRNGFSQVTAIFSDSTDLYFARQQVGERLTQAQENLPAGVQPQIGPVTTGLGEVVMYTVDYTHRRAKAPGGSTGSRDGRPTAAI